MSIDRAFELHPQSNIQRDETLEERLVPRRTTSRMSVGLEEHKHLRKAPRADMPLARTLKWVASLPPNVQPTALLRHYARIANGIAATWGHATSLRSYMDCLLERQPWNPPRLSARGSKRVGRPQALSRRA